LNLEGPRNTLEGAGVNRKEASGSGEQVRSGAASRQEQLNNCPGW
jgi:hypothetical protein